MTQAYDARTVEAIASMIEEWGTNNVGMLDPVSREQVKRIRALPTSPVQTTGEASEPSPLSERPLCTRDNCNRREPCEPKFLCDYKDDSGSAADGGSDALGETVAKLRELMAKVDLPLVQLQDSKGFSRVYSAPEEPHFRTGDLLAETFGDGDDLIVAAVNALPDLLTALEQRQEPGDCPFCGSREVGSFKTDDKVHPYRVVCQSCGNGTAHHGDFGMAWKAWCRRPLPSAPLPTQSKED